MDLSKIVKPKEVEKRTTFKLTKAGIDELNDLMGSFDLTHKKIFKIILSEQLSDHIFGMANKDHLDPSSYEIKKTMVIVSDDLEKLNSLSQKTGANRNQMVDGGIRILASMLREHRKDTFEKYRVVLKLFYDVLEQMERAEKELENLLPKDDYYLHEYIDVITRMDNLVNQLEKEIKQENSEQSEEGER